MFCFCSAGIKLRASILPLSYILSLCSEWLGEKPSIPFEHRTHVQICSGQTDMLVMFMEVASVSWSSRGSAMPAASPRSLCLCVAILSVVCSVSAGCSLRGRSQLMPTLLVLKALPRKTSSPQPLLCDVFQPHIILSVPKMSPWVPS